MEYTRRFRCVAVSENTNSFGLKQVVLVTATGIAYKACANSLNVPKEGDDVFVELITSREGNFLGYNFAKNGFEVPEKLPDVPKDVLKEIYK